MAKQPQQSKQPQKSRPQRDEPPHGQDNARRGKDGKVDPLQTASEHPKEDDEDEE